jgi:hypothetical protein
LLIWDDMALVWPSHCLALGQRDVNHTKLPALYTPNCGFKGTKGPRPLEGPRW